MECYSFEVTKRAKLDLSPAAIEVVASRFRTLSEPLRLRILQTLQGGERSVTELAGAVGSTQPNVSKHLKVLQEAGLVGRRQEGNTVYCHISDPSVFELCEVVCSSVRERLADQARAFAPPRRRKP
jgi:DNA-binding transcriptional ArsR family regulator